MKKCLLFRKLNSEKGAATVLVLCVTLILISLGTIALFTSVLNVSLSGKVMNWTQEYYALDTQVEEYVQMIDQQLVAAENDARIYVRNRYDKKLPDPDALPSEFTTGGTYDMGGDLDPANRPQAFFNNHFKEVWTKDTTGGAIEITLQDYLDDPVLVRTKSASYSEGTTTTEQAFSADVEKYTDELFDRVYFFMLSKRLNSLSGSVTSGAIVLIDREAPPTDICTKKFTDLGLATWEGMAPNDGDIKLVINVSNNSAEDPKEVKAQISIVKPHYKTILQTISTPVYGNPISTNAITAGGSVTFTSGVSATIEGDVYAAGTGGISVEGGSDVVICGNIYTQGDLAISGNNGRLQVNSAPSQVSYEHKEKIYGNYYFFDTSTLTTSSITLDEYLDSADSEKMPFFFKDFIDRDNVYCNSLLVKDGVNGGKLQIDGNIWTKDDIQMDGRNSSISIGTAGTSGTAIVPLTSYIGLNPYSEQNDPNSSSSVINNYPANDDGTVDSSIKINSNFVVPGVAFYEFDSGKDEKYRYGEKYYYKSAESVSARTTSPTAIFYAYFYDGSAGMPYNTFTSSENVDFDLITPTVEMNEMNLKKNALFSFFGANGNIKTNITTDLTAPDGYAAGVAFLQPDDGSYTSLYAAGAPSGVSGISTLPGSGQYLVNYSKLQNALMKAFDYKTKQLGKAAGSNFSDLINPLVPTGLSEIIRPDVNPVTGVRTLDLGPSADITEGIVYSDGDLTIQGYGVFKGTIICSGNVTFVDKPTIIYDEDVISDKLITYKNVRDFFAKGSTSGVIGTTNDYSSTSGERTVLKRYRILSWQEKSPAPGE